MQLNESYRSSKVGCGANLGVSKYETSLETQTVDVWGTASYEAVLEKIKKTGKEVVAGEKV